MSSPQLNLRYLLNNQRSKKDIKDIGNYGYIEFNDIKRIDMNIKGNIFISNNCCLYTGEIKKNYSTISFKGKKVSVLRLLYHNYINDIELSDILEYKCENPGTCCNLRHFNIKNKNNKNIQFKNIINHDIDPFDTINDDFKIDDNDIVNEIFTFEE